MTVAVYDLSGWGKLRFAGSDRRKFLQGLVTNDVLKLKPGAGQLDCVLTPKGKLVGDFALYDRGEDLFALLMPEAVGPVKQAFGKSIFLSQTAMADETSAFGLTLFLGTGAQAALKDVLGQEPPGADGSVMVAWQCREVRIGDGSAWVFTYPRFRQPAWIVSWSAGLSGRILPALAKDAGRMKVLSRDEFEAVRIDAGIPVTGVDTDADTFPAEAGLDSALSYDKGCYMGQEVTTRLKNLGHVNRRLAILRLADRPQSGAPVRVAGAEAGKISSAVCLAPGRCVALAMLRAEFSAPGTDVAVGSEPGPAIAGTILIGGPHPHP